MKKFEFPKFSVILPVYFGDNLCDFRQALDSIYKQDLKFDELLIVCDGPIKKDLNCYVEDLNKDKKVQILRLEKNLGLAKSLNIALLKCKNDLVFRMDADDICVPERFRLQLEFMMKNPEIDVLSGYIREFDPNLKKSTYIKEVPLEHEEILKYSKLRNPINHMAVLFRKSVILKYGGYPDFRRSQDYALWSFLLIKGCRFANLDKVLVNARTGNELYKRRNFYYFLQEMQLIFYQKQIGLISYYELFISLVLRFLIRLAPDFIKKYFYTKITRKFSSN